MRGTYWYDLHARNPFAAAVKRLLDVAIAAPLLVLGAPLLIFRERRVGFRGHEFEAFVFRGGFLKHFPQLLNVFDGSMTLVGPRAMEPSEVERHDARRFAVKPGMTGTWRFGQGSECELDRAYVNEWSLQQDLVILMKTMLRRGAPRP